MLPSLRRLAALAVVGCSLICDGAQAHSQGRAPLNYLSLVEEAEIQTPSHRVHAHSTFDLTFFLHRKRQRIKLRLEPNHDIIPDGAQVQYLDKSGTVTRTEPIRRADHKVFRGKSWLEDEDGSWIHVGSARIMLRRDGIRPLFDGAFSIMHDNHHLQLRSSYMQTKHELDPHAEDADDEYVVVSRDSDTVDDDAPHRELRRSVGQDLTCEADRLEFNIRPDHPIHGRVLKRDTGFWGMAPTGSLLGKRQIDPILGGNSAGVNLRSSIGQTVGCPGTRKVALIGVATDCTYTDTFNSTDSARANIISQINSASNLYESTFNISLGLSNLTVSEKSCPGSAPASAPWNLACSQDVTIQDRLNLFSKWRGDRQDSNSHWTLLTNCRTGTAVGLAWLGQACVQDAQANVGLGRNNESVSGANVVVRTDREWQVIAHETGHTFGAVHDCTSRTCNDGTSVSAQQCCPLSGDECDAGERYLMNPSTSRGISDFSPCSIGNICSALRRNSVNSDCLLANTGVPTITGNQCGNGIVETGEECDCGGEANCGDNRCCDPETCKFRNNVVCDDSNEDCCQDCQFAPSSQVCRSSTGECDPEEKCTGNTPLCPSDETQEDGSDCGADGSGLTCASGHCTSRDLQCKSLMGSFTTKNDTFACDSSTCQLSCASPQFGQGVCYSMQQNFLDGTPCGGGGNCQNGRCDGSNPVTEIGSWINRNKTVVIAVGSVLGFLLFVAVSCCVYGCCRRRRIRKRHRSRKSPSPPGWTILQHNLPRGHHMTGTVGADGRGASRGDVSSGRRSRGPSSANANANAPPPYWDGPMPPPEPSYTRAPRYA